MPKSHTPYPPEFRRQMVEIVRAGRTPEEKGKEFSGLMCGGVAGRAGTGGICRSPYEHQSRSGRC